MKTYQKTESAPRLIILHDESPESPRTWDNLGYFIGVDRRYNSPDQNETLESIVKNSGEVAESLDEHKALIINAIKEQLDENVIYISPVTKYEHGGVSYSLGTAHGFDNSNNGFYIVTDKSLARQGTPNETVTIERIIKAELETYNAYANGEVYGFKLFDEKGDEIDSCWGFYDLDDIKEHLPDEWKDENMRDYLK
jgi:hypothetical protein